MSGKPRQADLAEEAVVEFMDSMSNWGRWGADDESGTLNLITESTVKAAIQLVQIGKTVSCARAVDFAPKVGPAEGPIPPLHFMLQSGESASPTSMDTANDWVALPLHGSYLTHLDAHGHLFWKGRMYNGHDASSVTTVDGATKGSVALARCGIVTRGVLLDIPMARGVNFLDHDDSVSIADLESAEQMTGVTAKSGDLLFVRTGYRSDGSRSQDSSPGLRAECLPFLKAREPAILATDTITDAAPNQYRSIPFPVHAVCIVAMGTLIIDNCDLEALSQTCQHLGRWEFLAVVASLGLNGATGSPVNPLALF